MMSDNNLPESERRLQEIGNQLGMPILAPATKIQSDGENVPSARHNDADLDGATDSQSSSKNPLLQYLVAGAIGLGAVGVPLTVLFGLGGTTPTATKPTTAPEVEDSAPSTSDRELDNLKTQTALDIQAKSEPQTVAPTPKPAPVKTPAPTPIAAPQPQPKPVATAPTPQPTTIAVQPPTVVAATPAPVARPNPRPLPAPAIAQPRPNPIPAERPNPPTPPVTPVAQEEAPLSFERASALGMFGGDGDKPDRESSVLAEGDRSLLTLSLPVGANVAARTVTPYSSLSDRNSTANSTETRLSVRLDQPIQLAQGFNLPAGTIVQFGATVNDNGAVAATSRGVFIDGTEIQVPAGAFALTASNSAALVANQRALREGELAAADTTAAIWGAAGSLGKALIDSGNTSVVNTSGLGTSVVQTNNGNVNIPGAILNGAFSPLAKAKETRANALAQELQQSSKLNEIPVGSPVRVFVAAAATVRVPVASDATATLTPERDRSISGEVERPPTMIPTQAISAASDRPVAPIPTTATTQPVVAPSPATPVSATTPADRGSNTPSPIAPTKPNNVANTQASNPTVDRATMVMPQPVTTSTPPIQSTPTPTQFSQTPTATVSQPEIAAPAPPTSTPGTIITQPATVPQSTSAVTAQPTPIPQQFPAATTQPPLAQQQPTNTTQPTGATTTISPLAPTKPNNIANTQPLAPTTIQSTSGIDAQSPPIVSPEQLTEGENSQTPVTATDPPTSTQSPSSLVPIRFDRDGRIEPIAAPTPRASATTSNPAMAPLP